MDLKTSAWYIFLNLFFKVHVTAKKEKKKKVVGEFTVSYTRVLLVLCWLRADLVIAESTRQPARCSETKIIREWGWGGNDKNPSSARHQRRCGAITSRVVKGGCGVKLQHDYQHIPSRAAAIIEKHVHNMFLNNKSILHYEEGLNRHDVSTNKFVRNDEQGCSGYG